MGQIVQLVPASAAPDDFMALWSLWLGMNRGTGKKEALRAWARALTRASPETIIAAAERFAASQAGEDRRFIPHAATWLNQERWEDQVPSSHAEHETASRASFDQWCIEWVNKGRSLALRRADADQFVRSQVKAGNIAEDMARKAGYL